MSLVAAEARKFRRVNLVPAVSLYSPALEHRQCHLQLWWMLKGVGATDPDVLALAEERERVQTLKLCEDAASMLLIYQNIKVPPETLTSFILRLTTI